MKKDKAILVQNVSKDFVLPHEKNASVKGMFTGIFSHKGKAEKQHALRNISFDVNKGEFFGVVGRNGSGKSTMLKILAGIYQPTKGSVNVQGKLVPFIELGVGFNAELTGRENVYLNGALLGFSRKEIDYMYDDIVTFAELERFMDQKLKNYSSGMQVRLAFSMAIRSEADILLVDEVLAVGDADFQRKCYDYFSQLKKNKTTVVFVTHDMNAIREYCDRAVLIEENRMLAEGTAEEIASKYTKLFTDDSLNQETSTQKKRWGEGGVQFTSAEVKLDDSNKQSDGTQGVNIYIEATVGKVGVEPIIGFAIKNASGVPVTGTNTQLKKQKLSNIKPGETIMLTWQLPNIFSDGLYYIDVAATGADGRVYEWWEDAVKFRSKKEEHVPYAVLPKIDLTYTVHGNRS